MVLGSPVLSTLLLDLSTSIVFRTSMSIAFRRVYVFAMNRGTGNEQYNACPSVSSSAALGTLRVPRTCHSAFPDTRTLSNIKKEEESDGSPRPLHPTELRV